MLSVMSRSGGCSVRRLILSTSGASLTYQVCRNTSRYRPFGLYCIGEDDCSNDDVGDDDDGDNEVLRF